MTGGRKNYAHTYSAHFFFFFNVLTRGKFVPLVPTLALTSRQRSPINSTDLLIIKTSVSLKLQSHPRKHKQVQNKRAAMHKFIGHRAARVDLMNLQLCLFIHRFNRAKF